LTHDLPISKQTEALNISRGSVYYLPRPVPKTELAIMHRIGRLHLEYPFAGMVDGKNFRLADQVRYILGRAAEHDGRVVTIGQHRRISYT
jgi:hypothetical protein